DFSVDPRLAGSPVPYTEVGAVMNGTLIGAGADQISDPSDLTLTLSNGSTETFTITAGGIDTLAELQTAINAAFENEITVGLAGNQLTLLSQNPNLSLTVGTTGSAGNLGLANAAPGSSVGGGYVQANEAGLFEEQSISGGAVTIYDEQGTPVQVQLRWAKTNSSEAGGVDTWNLFYQSNSEASGTNPMWTNAGTDFTFGPNSLLNPPIATTLIPNLTVNGINVGNITLSHGST